MALNPKVLKVKILGQDYVIRSSAGQKYLNEVSAYVNEKMEEIMASGIDDSQQLRIAVLTAMNITDELFSARQNLDSDQTDIDQKISSLIELIDESL